MTHDPTKGCYTLDTLRALNPLYDHEHGLTQQDVEAVNAMKKYIESTRSADRPHCGDRVRYVSRHGDYAGSALITYDRNDMLTVCIYSYDPFASRTKDGVQCCSSGGPFTHVAAAAFRYEGPRRVLSKSGVTTDLAATGRSASKPKSRGGATVNPIRSMATLRPRRGAGSMSIGSNGRAATIFTARTAGRSATKQRSRRSCTTTKLPYFRDVRPGSWSSGATAPRRDLCRRSSGMRSTRRSPIAVSTTSRNP